MEAIQAQIERIDKELAKPYDKGSQSEVNAREELEREKAALLEKLRQKEEEQQWLAQLEAEKGQRDQQAAETIDSYVDTVAQIWEALFPVDAYERLFGGVNEYADKRQDFYKLNHAYFAEKVAKINTAHESEIAAKDEKYRALSVQMAEASSQLSDLRRQLEESERALADLERDHKELTEQLDRMDAEMIANDRLIAELQAENADLKSKLAAANQPKTADKPSDNLQTMLEEVKQKNAAAYQTAIQKADAALVRLGLVEPKPPAIEEVQPAGEDSFRGQNGETPSADATNGGVLAPETGVTFPGSESSVDGQDYARLAPEVSRAEFEALKADVEVLKRRAGMVA